MSSSKIKVDEREAFLPWAMGLARWGVSYLWEGGSEVTHLIKERVLFPSYYTQHPEEKSRSVSEKVAAFISRSLESGACAGEGLVFFQGLDLQERCFYILPRLKRAYVISESEKMLLLLHTERGGEALSPGYQDILTPVMGANNMLLCPYSEHRRLRGVVERYFTKHQATSRDHFKKIMIAGIKSLHMLFNRQGDDPILHYVYQVVAKTTLGLLHRDLAELFKLLPEANKRNPQVKLQLEHFFRCIYNEKRFKADKALEGLSKSPTLSLDEKISTAILLITAGTHTTTNSIKCFLNYLELNPHYREEIRQEWSKFIAGRTVTDPETFFEAFYHFISQSVWLEACCQETLRLFPVASIISRVAKKSIKLNDVWINEGDEIHLNILAYQRQKEIWGDDAAVYRPERWLDGKKAPLLNFSSGNQKCLGVHLAKYEALIFAGLFCIVLNETGPRSALNHAGDKMEDSGMYFNGFNLESTFTIKPWKYEIPHHIKKMLPCVSEVQGDMRIPLFLI